LKTLDKFTTGKSNFEDVFASQNCVFGKAGLGFYPQSKENGISKPFSTTPEKKNRLKGRFNRLLHDSIA